MQTENRVKLAVSKHVHVKRLRNGAGSDKARYAVDLHPAFNVGVVPNGGYVAAHFLAAALAHVPGSGHADVISAHWDFLGRTRSGPGGILVVDEAKIGPSMSVLHISFHQEQEANAVDTKPLIIGTVTCKSMQRETGPSLKTPWELSTPSSSSPVDDPDWQPVSPQRALRVTKNWDVYERNSTATATAPSASLDLWFRHGSGERITNLDLPHLMDITPAMYVYNLLRDEFERANAAATNTTPSSLPTFWFPTLNMHMGFKQSLPESGEPWMRVRTTAKVIRNGRFDCDVEVFDLSGCLVAQARHTAMIMDIARNVANRTKPKSANI